MDLARLRIPDRSQLVESDDDDDGDEYTDLDDGEVFDEFEEETEEKQEDVDDVWSRSPVLTQRSVLSPQDSDTDVDQDFDEVVRNSRKRKNDTVLLGRSIAKQAINEPMWTTTAGPVKGYISVSHNTNVFLQNKIVAQNRLKKFKCKVDPTFINNHVIGNVSSCVPGCKKGCHSLLSLKTHIDCRASSFANASTEQEVTQHLVGLLRLENQHVGMEPGNNGNIKYLIDGHPICTVFWAKAHGASEDKMKKVRAMLRNKSTITRHGNLGKSYKGAQADRCHAFWYNFFDMHCQRPNDELRLFPVNNSFRFIYDSYFVRWLEKQRQPAGCDNIQFMPSFSVFKKARHHPSFKDVTKRARHYHCLCSTCSCLNERRLKGFENNAHLAVWTTMFEAHEQDKLLWRKLEAARAAECRADPTGSILLQYDDTSSLGLPQLSNRGIKNLTTSRFHVIPFNICNYASGESVYVYTVKNRYKKGGNRLCTVIYHMLKKIKFGTHECRHARTLYLHADNASENKNNTFFTFLSELVQKGWYDKIIVEYGPPGHTHNGRDAVHHIHNRIAGNFFSMTLGEFQSKWVHSWRKENTMPTAVVADVQYDFDRRYFSNEKMSGHTNTTLDTDAVYAFKIERGKSNDIEVQWKSKPTDPIWRGADHQPHTPGFVLLNIIPVRVAPHVILPNQKVTAKPFIEQACGSTMKKVIESHLTEEQTDFTLNWLRQSMTYGSMPYQSIPGQQEPTKADWGPLVDIGAPGATGQFQLMEAAQDHEDQFWTLPQDLKNRADMLSEDLRRARDLVGGTPNIRYSTVKHAAARLQHAAAAAAAASSETTDESKQNLEIEQRQVSQTDLEGVELEEEKQWGAPAVQCVVGKFAVVEIEFADGSTGIDIMKIVKVRRQGDESEDGVIEEDNFDGICLVLNEGTANTQACYNGKWGKGDSHKLEMNYCWSVLYYFQKMVKSSKYLFKLPKAVTSFLQEEAARREKDWFSRPTKVDANDSDNDCLWDGSD